MRAMPVVTIARQLGSGGEEIAALVAQRLGARLLDRDLLVRASERSGIPIARLEEFDERGRSMWRRPIDLVRLVPMPPINPDMPDVTGDRYPPTGPVRARGEGITAPAYWAAEAYATLLARTMQAEAGAGAAAGSEQAAATGSDQAHATSPDQSVVIVGRCGNEALAELPTALHVLVIAGQRTRIQRIEAGEQASGYHALDRLKASDRRRAAYARQFYHARWLDPVRYDLTTNTDDLDFEAAADLIVAATRRLSTSAPAAQTVAAV
jgi:cytidylate kinase